MDSRSAVHQRIEQAILFGLESPTVEFKESQPFDVLKFKIARASQGMANNRDGGLIIVGFSERPNEKPHGADEAIAATYKFDKVYEFVNGYATPAIELQMLHVVVHEATFIAIVIPPLGRTPTICRKNTPPTVTRSGDVMAIGNIFVRTRDRIGTSPATNAAMIDELLQASAAHRARELIELLQAPVASPTRSARLRYDREIEDLGGYF